MSGSLVWGWKRSEGNKVALMTVTPEMAKEYLANEIYTKGTKVNSVRRYATYMAKGKWFQNGETIKFNQDGHGIDGHHRCMACVAAGVPFQTLVVFGVLHDYVTSINVGDTRNLATAIGAKYGAKLNTFFTTTANRMLQADGTDKSAMSTPSHRLPNRISPESMEKFLIMYKDGIAFAEEGFRSHQTGLSHASLRAAVAKAYYHTRRYAGGRERLREFCEVVCSGMPNDVVRDKAAIILRNNLIGKNNRAPTSHDQGMQVYLRCTGCLEKFMCGIPINQVYVSPVDPFLLSKPADDFAEQDLAFEAKVADAIKNTVMAVPCKDPVFA